MEGAGVIAVSRRWAARVPARRAGDLGAIRCAAGVEVCASPGDIWLRGGEWNERLGRHLAAIPEAERFWVLPDKQLLAMGRRVPHGHLPSGPWERLRSWLHVELPTAQWSGQLSERVELALVRSTQPAEANLLLCEIEPWRGYGEQAPQVRLACWTFAASRDGRVAIRGAPTPPLPGVRFVAHCGVAVPLGWGWSPAVDAEVVAALFEVRPGELVLLHLDGTWEWIRADQFAKATRSAIRMTAEVDTSG